MAEGDRKIWNGTEWITIGGKAGLPTTGQTTSYRTGDDGDVEAGIPDTDRFTDNGDGTISDHVTGLMWRKWSYGRDQSTGSGTNGTLDWNAAVDLQGDSHAGYSDWRLPNAMELFSLVKQDATIGEPYTYTGFFPNTEPDYYWTATTRPDDTTRALIVSFQGGLVNSGAKTTSLCARLVRQI